MTAIGNCIAELKSSIISLAEQGVSAVPELVDAGLSPESAATLVEDVIASTYGASTILQSKEVVEAPRPLWDIAERRRLGDSTEVSIIARLADPYLTLFGNFMSASECKELIELAGSRMQRAMVSDSQGDFLSEDRTGDSAEFERGELPLIATIEGRVQDMTGWAAVDTEPLQVFRYGLGQEYRPHVDFFGTDELVANPALRQRVATLIIYLGRPLAGGATVFPALGVEISPQPGHALFFNYPAGTADSLTLHAGAPVLSGEKWIATKWFWRQPNR
jgi:prolyl 4-hydroxylase